MEYQDLEILKSGYKGIHDHIVPSMLRKDEELIRKRIIPSINPIIWMSWHMLRVEDMFLSNVVFKKQQVFHSEEWRNRLQIETAHVGTGMTVSETDSLASRIDVDALKDYNVAVEHHTSGLLSAIADLPNDQLDSAEDIERRLRIADAFPENVLVERASAYAPTPISACLLGVISHSYMHFGQYLALTKPI